MPRKLCPSILVKRRFINALLSMSFATTVFAPLADAAPLRYSIADSYNPQSLSVHLPIAKIGKLALPGATLNIDDNTIDVEAVPEALFDPRTVLSGVVITAATQPAQQPNKVVGLAYFFSGSWMPYLSQQPVFELVETTDGKMISGLILEGDNKSLVIHKTDGNNESIEFTRITNISSPRAFTFQIQLLAQPQQAARFIEGEALGARFQPASAGGNLATLPRPLFKPLGDEHGLKAAPFGALILCNFISLVAPAIAAPLVLARSNNGAKEKVIKANLGH